MRAREMFRIGDRVCYTEYIMRQRFPIDEVVEVKKIMGQLKTFVDYTAILLYLKH